MYDYTLRFADADAAKAHALAGAYWHEGWGDEPGGWDTSRVTPGGTVLRVTGTETVTDPESGAEYEEETGEPEPWWYLTIMLPHIDQALADDPATMMVTDREAAARGDDDWIIVSRIPPEDWHLYRPSSTPAGSRYPIGEMIT